MTQIKITYQLILLILVAFYSVHAETSTLQTCKTELEGGLAGGFIAGVFDSQLRMRALLLCTEGVSNHNLIRHFFARDKMTFRFFVLCLITICSAAGEQDLSVSCVLTFLFTFAGGAATVAIIVAVICNANRLKNSGIFKRKPNVIDVE
ncbi:hypothetical protein Btru_058700 [Bulinus truncatus]|nr:hypothetical protein Btru_058700 [Bulinus truncatus]